MLNELDTVVLTEDLPEHGLKRGDVGTVIFADRGGRGYEVEFKALTGDTVAIVAAGPTQVRPVDRKEIASARMM
ncbi:MAG: DUF4926 domain-containing protein [Chloroflexi bacterium]|nr:DUF4926 domain-containing protein [Chloroflexota bacterium]